MKLTIAAALLLCLASVSSASVNIILVRHAEKAGGDNPPLTLEGQARAKSLANLSKVFDIAAVYTSHYRRTMMTGAPLAEALGLAINSSIDPTNYEALLEDIANKYDGRTVLLVGHSNTIPGFLNHVLKDNTYTDIDESNFSNLYLLQYRPGADSEVLGFTYRYQTDTLILLPSTP